MILLRDLKESDLEKLRLWRMSPEVTKYLCVDPVITEEAQEQWYKEMKERGDDIYWIVNYNGVDIGYASLNKIDTQNRNADPGVYIGMAECRGIGLGGKILRKIEEYAFWTLYLHKLYGYVLSENYPALKIYTENDWKLEGFLKDHILKHGEFYSVYIMSLLRKV